MMSAESINSISGQKQSNYASVKHNWIISRYARLKKSTNPNTQGKEKWDIFDDSNGVINVSILNCNRMIINQGHRILENHDLVMCSKYLRGITRGDSMSFVCRIEDDHRQFRVKFQSKISKPGAEECNECTKELNKFFPVQNLSETTQTQGIASQTATTSQTLSGESQTLSGESSVADLSKYFVSPSAYSLPYIYKHSPIPTDDLEEIIWMCLSDKQFPAFVSQVGDVLKGLADI